MKQSFSRKLVSVFLTFGMVVGLFAVMPMAASAATEPGHEVFKMGVVEAHVFTDPDGQLESCNVYLNLNGYKPQTVYSVIKGDFTEAEISEAADKWGLEYAAHVLPIVSLYDGTVTDWESWINTVNGGVRHYLRNVYRSRDLTSITYSIIQPGDQPANGLSIKASDTNVSLSTGWRDTTHYIYVDGQLILETTVVDHGVLASYKVHPANFQIKPAEGAVNVAPSGTKVYVDGQQVSAETYNIGGNNYMRLRDIAYLLKDKQAKFDVVVRQNGSMIDVVLGETYLAVGGELSKLPSGRATLSQAEIACEYEEEGYTHPDDFPYYRPYTNLRAGERKGPSGKLLPTYIATYQELFTPIGYNIGGHTFYKLSDIAEITGFEVDWIENSIHITSTGRNLWY